MEYYVRNRNNLYVGIAYSALDISDYNGLMSNQWVEIVGHKYLRVFLLGKMSFNKPEFKRFREYRTKQSVNGTNNQFFRSDDLTPADECNEVF